MDATTLTAPARVLLVDDEPVARRGLRRLLEQRPDVQVIGECEDGEAAVRFIEAHAPELVVLDVQLPGLDGLSVVRRVGATHMPPVVFVTAYDEFAIAAFELAAVDYVVKPFTDERLAQAVTRGLRHRMERSAARSLMRLLDTLGDARPPALGPARAEPHGATESMAQRYRARFLVSIGARDAVIHASEVQWIRADGYYATLVTHDRKEYLVRSPLDQLERELDPAAFLRVHRSAIVNLNEVRGADRSTGRSLVLQLRDGTRVAVSRSRREAVLAALGAISP